MTSFRNLGTAKRKTRSTTKSRTPKNNLVFVTLENIILLNQLEQEKNSSITMSNTVVSTAFRDAVNSDHHMMQIGENGMNEYTDFGVGSNILALNQLVRGGNPVSLVKEILNSPESTDKDVTDLFVLLFVTRNTRGGKGEKKLSYDLFLTIYEKYPKTAMSLLKLFPHYGYWKDLLQLSVLEIDCVSTSVNSKTAIFDESMRLMKEQLLLDIVAMETVSIDIKDGQSSKGKSQHTISLLPKWLPREGSYFDKKLKFVSKFSSLMWPSMMTPKPTYRKTVSKLTNYLELPEVLLSAKREDEINFQRLASRATLLLNKTFLNEDISNPSKQRSNDPKRIRMTELFLEHVIQKGLKGEQVSPHEIVSRIMKAGHISKSMEMVLDAQWKDLWKKIVENIEKKAAEEKLEFSPTQVVPLSDVSGSMHGVPMEVSIAMGIGISEITHPAFRDMVMTFESKPRWHRLNHSDTIVQKVKSLQRAPWGYSTNFVGAFQLICDMCEKHKLSYEDMPSLIVFSDMQFNAAANNNNTDVMFDVMKQRMAKTAQKLGWDHSENHLKTIVFWNLRNTNGHPVDKDTEGAVLLSGYSPSLLKLIMNGDVLKEEEVEVVDHDGNVTTEKIRVTPEQILRKMLDDSIYDPVREVLSGSTEEVFGNMD